MVKSTIDHHGREGDAVAINKDVEKWWIYKAFDRIKNKLTAKKNMLPFLALVNS